MKYKNVFLIWLWANVMLIVSAIILISLHYYLKDGMIDRLSGIYQNVFITSCLGFVSTIPSLILMLFFHLMYSKNKAEVSQYLRPYCILILSINLLYLLSYEIVFGLKRSWGGPITMPMIFILTNAAGLIGLYIEHNRIKKGIKY